MIQFENISFDIPAWDGLRREAGELWRMEKDGKTAICSIWTNPDGAELRLTIDGKLALRDVSHHHFALPIVALAWRERYAWIKGWR